MQTPALLGAFAYPGNGNYSDALAVRTRLSNLLVEG